MNEGEGGVDAGIARFLVWFSAVSTRKPYSRRISGAISRFSLLSSTTSAFKPSGSVIFSTGRCSACVRMGKQMINSVPLPCAVCTLMVPPIISTMFLVIAIPRPVPWILNTAKKLYKAFEKAQTQHNNNM